MSAFALQGLYAEPNDGFVHVAWDGESNWWRVFRHGKSYGGTAWLDESTKLAEGYAKQENLTVKVHKKTPMRKR